MKRLVCRMVIKVSGDIEAGISGIEAFMGQLEDAYKGDIPVEIRIGSVRVATPFTVCGLDALHLLVERFGNVGYSHFWEDETPKYMLLPVQQD